MRKVQSYSEQRYDWNNMGFCHPLQRQNLRTKNRDRDIGTAGSKSFGWIYKSRNIYRASTVQQETNKKQLQSMYNESIINHCVRAQRYINIRCTQRHASKSIPQMFNYFLLLNNKDSCTELPTSYFLQSFSTQYFNNHPSNLQLFKSTSSPKFKTRPKVSF